MKLVKIVSVIAMLSVLCGCTSSPPLTDEELAAAQLVAESKDAIHDQVQSCFAASQIGSTLGSDFAITGLNMGFGVGPSHPSRRYCASCIDCTFGFCRAVVRCCEPWQGRQCEPCYDGE